MSESEEEEEEEKKKRESEREEDWRAHRQADGLTWKGEDRVVSMWGVKKV